jgi:hypothetical protein
MLLQSAVNAAEAVRSAQSTKTLIQSPIEIPESYDYQHNGAIQSMPWIALS